MVRYFFNCQNNIFQTTQTLMLICQKYFHYYTSDFAFLRTRIATPMLSFPFSSWIRKASKSSSLAMTLFHKYYEFNFILYLLVNRITSLYIYIISFQIMVSHFQAIFNEPNWFESIKKCLGGQNNYCHQVRFWALWGRIYVSKIPKVFETPLT